MREVVAYDGKVDQMSVGGALDFAALVMANGMIVVSSVRQHGASAVKDALVNLTQNVRFCFTTIAQSCIPVINTSRCGEYQSCRDRGKSCG